MRGPTAPRLLGVELRDGPQGAWRTLTTHRQSPGAFDTRWIGPVDAAGSIAADGSFQGRLRSFGAKAALAVDLVEVLRIPSLSGEINGDGAVGSSDLAILLNLWGSCGG